MDDLSITTPALLFPTISLLLLAYTNRYIAISNRIRALHTQYKLELSTQKEEQSQVIIDQISILKKRILLIRNMQLFGISSMFVAAFSMFMIYYGFEEMVHAVFGISLILILVSISLCSIEVYWSNKALLVQLKDIEHLT